MSAEDSLNRYYAREAKKSMASKRKNEKPEFEFKKVFVPWLIKERGFSVNVVESKAVYNFAAGRYDHGQTDAGFSDIVGVTPYQGVACYIELKAPGERLRLKPHQYEFLVEKIKAGAFGICTDSMGYFDGIYNRWRGIRERGHYQISIDVLLKELPKPRERKDNLEDITGPA